VHQDLLAFLRSEEARSLDTSLLAEVETAINSYNGAPYGDEEEGRSQVTARDVAETVDHMTVSMLRTFVAGDRVVELEPNGPDDEQIADDATEALTADMRRNGYRLIHDWIKAGNLEKIGIVKTCVERKVERVESIVPDVMIPDNAIEAEETGEFDEFGNALFRVVTLEEGEPAFRDYNVPLEEFRFSPDARDLETAVYLAHVVEKSLSELAGMGFDPALLDGIQGDGDPHGTLAQARDEWRSAIGNDREGALRKVWLREEYVLFDLNGDGLAERLCVHRVGDTLLEVREADYQPFEYWTPFPMPGRLVGQSLADKVIDIQRVNTVLERNMLDSLYFSTAPGTYVHEDSCGDHTIDDLLTVRPGRLVRYVGNQPPIPEARNDTSAIAMQAIEFKIGQRESRTGITRLNQGLDADALNKTATGTALMQAQGQQIEEYLARNFAEALARLFRKKLKLRARYGRPFQIRVDGEFRTVDPAQWGDDMDVMIRVGLGSGRKEQRLMYRNMLLGIQAQVIQGGLPIVGPEHVYNSIAGLVKDAGLGSPADYAANPAQLPPQPEKPDPKMVEAETRAQVAQADQERKAQEAAAKMELEQFKAAVKAQQDQQRIESEATLAAMRMEFEQRLAAFKAQSDAEIRKFREGGRLDK